MITLGRVMFAASFHFLYIVLGPVCSIVVMSLCVISVVFELGSTKVPERFQKMLMKTWIFCNCYNFIYRVSVIMLNYEWKVIFKKKWIEF